jgi:RNAse (barnase) inhibitor barstar
MTAQISTLGELLSAAGTQWRVYDIGRRITKIDKTLFAQIENTQAPYPYPLGGHALLAIQFWDNQATLDPYVWFLKFPLDEQSKLIVASRDHFASMVLEALGTQLTGEQAEGKLDNNPYVFTPNANKLAAFNALLKCELNRPASQYYEYCELYFANKLPNDAWQSMAVQGIADFAFRLNHGQNRQNLTQMWDDLPLEVKQPLSAMLEHVAIDTGFSEQLKKAITVAIEKKQLDELVCHLRALSGSKAKGLVEQTVDALLNSQYNNEADILLTLAGRCWETFLDPQRLFKFLDCAAHNTKIEGLFASIFADLVAIPNLRPHVLAILRAENRSDKLSRAIGRLFS